MTPLISESRRKKLQNIIDSYVDGGGQRKIPGLLYLGFGSDGRPVFEHYAGTRGITSQMPMDKDTVFWLASFTKLICSVACMQLVEQGRLRLDDAEQIEALSPELRDVKVLERSPDGEYRLVDKERKITLRMLLNHTGEKTPSPLNPCHFTRFTLLTFVCLLKPVLGMLSRMRSWPIMGALLASTISAVSGQTFSVVRSLTNPAANTNMARPWTGLVS